MNGHLVTEAGLTVFWTCNGSPWGWTRMEPFPETWRTPHTAFATITSDLWEST